ncbi:YggS family pyridoxal phosphate-dependent enzyme [Pectinatus haikarae]|uniref:Pyridoxal phosphate homeostasis protein n=1 Tax=Pectinatus haikarae TaxID=349096 RepID=A0ABT9Y5A4_9FIRM|nr:YggS family pyridoxal phosphate-dependent enzyme [Pectinatus haikarae]MDQ0203015.1 pyridoxal phosphate enzyme (YggS family) [Pectinatus haikarae]
MIRENIAAVETFIKEASEKRQSDMTEKVKLVAVTKNHTVSEIREAIDAGTAFIGENRIQEASEKYQQLGNTVEWHLIGHLQTNKAKQAVKIFDLIESVDSIKIAEAINKEAAKIDKVQDILVQVNLVKEQSKNGVYMEDLPALLLDIDSLEKLRLRGLMFIAPNVENLEEVRPMFNSMYKLFRKVQKMEFLNADIKYLSMGMTHDYKIAIEEGANIVRVGTAIFGPRQY